MSEEKGQSGVVSGTGQVVMERARAGEGRFHRESGQSENTIEIGTGKGERGTE